MSDRGPDAAAFADTARQYRHFAEREARGRSPLYEALATVVASDLEVLAFLQTLPPAKRQPNLLLAAVRHLFGTPTDGQDFRRRLMSGLAAVKRLMMERSTQTNEPARCATLLPVLARLPQPLALIEVGASAGLCLLPDLYGYDYGRVRIAAEGTAAPVFPCIANAATPLPATPPQVAWRAGLDLHLVDAIDPQKRTWLESLVWPEQTDRLTRLRAALDAACAMAPRIMAGDLRTDLAALAAEAPQRATLVIFHTAVLSYVVSQQERDAFAETARRLAGCWISNEAPAVFPDIAARAGRTAPTGRFLLSVDGLPTAWTDPHGAAIDWIGA
jgi:hypothetical protein